MPGKEPIRKRPSICCLLLLLLTLLLLPARQAAAAESGNLPASPQAAILLPLSGTFAELGQLLRSGFEQGFSYAADHGGPQIAVSYLDTESDPETARTLVELLASEGQVSLAAGTPLNPCAWTATQAAEKNGLPFLIVGADRDNLINEKSVYSFRITRPRAALEKTLKDFIKSRRPAIRTMAIIRGENPCAVRNARRGRRLCARLGLDLAIWETYRNSESNFYDLLNLVRDRRPELLLLVTSPAATRKFWLQGRRLEIMPENTIALPEDCFPPTPAPADAAPPAGLLRPARWLPPAAEQGDYPALADYRQAAAFATAQLITARLKDNSSQAPALLAAALEKTSLPTIYGKITFAGPGRGHQNQLPLPLVTTTSEGAVQTIFPPIKNRTQ